jgi:hypothetical protein
VDTGFPLQDAQSDFARTRRRRALERLAARLRREPDDVDLILPFEEVVEALGRVSERSLGLQTIPLYSIVGTVDRTTDFDRHFRPTSRRVQQRWERIAAAERRGQDMPPISVYRIGDLHFVRDGHHRVSVARAQRRKTIEAYVTEVQTRIGATSGIRLADLPLKGHERVFLERVPLPPEARAEVRVSDPWDYAKLAEGVEAWGFRAMQERSVFMTREEVAREWYEEEYRPVVAMLRGAGLPLPAGTETDAYMWVVTERYRLMRTHTWNEGVVERLRRELR